MSDAERTQKLEDALYGMIELFDEINNNWVMIGDEDEVTEAIALGLDAINSDEEGDDA